MARHRTTALFVLVSVLAACGEVSRAEESDESIFGRARAGYRENMRRLGVFRCVVEQEIAYTNEHYDVLRARIARIEKSLPELPAEQRGRAEVPLRRWRDQFNSKAIYPLRKSAAFVVGSTSLQVVVPQDSPLPGVPLERQSDLTGEYTRSHVLSWSPAQQPAGWFWQGDGRWNDGRYNATLSPERPQEILDFPVIPAGGASLTFFERGRLSPFDEFFEETEGQGQIGVLGREQVDGRDVLIVERIQELPQSRTSVKAWLSVQHGYFPVRIERKLCSNALSLEEAEPYEFLKVPGFFRTESGAFYPLSWAIENKVDDDRTAAVRAAKLGPSVLYTSRTESWKVHRIQSNQPEPTLLSVIRFPDGTSCWDEERKVRFTVGESK